MCCSANLECFWGAERADQSRVNDRFLFRSDSDLHCQSAVTRQMEFGGICFAKNEAASSNAVRQFAWAAAATILTTSCSNDNGVVCVTPQTVVCAVHGIGELALLLCACYWLTAFSTATLIAQPMVFKLLDLIRWIHGLMAVRPPFLQHKGTTSRPWLFVDGQRRTAPPFILNSAHLLRAA